MKTILFSFSILLLLGCKKEKLNPSDEMIGEWEWVYSKFSYTRYAGMQQYKTTVVYFSPNDIGYKMGYNASLEIKKNGSLILSKDYKTFFKLNSRKSNETVLDIYFDSITGNDLLVIEGFPIENFNESNPKVDYSITSRYFYDHVSPSKSPVVYNYFKRK